jgi:hypothetical protein
MWIQIIVALITSLPAIIKALKEKAKDEVRACVGDACTKYKSKKEKK